MFDDVVVSVRCPSCGNPTEAWMMKSNDADDGSVTEHYICPCGCRFRVEVAVERPPLSS